MSTVHSGIIVSPERRADVPGGPSRVGLPAIIPLRAIRVGVSRLLDVEGQARDLRVVVRAEPLVAYVHLRQTTMHVVAAIVEPAADVLAVRLGRPHRLLAVRRETGLESGGEPRLHLFCFGFEL